MEASVRSFDSSDVDVATYRSEDRGDDARPGQVALALVMYAETGPDGRHRYIVAAIAATSVSPAHDLSRIEPAHATRSPT